MMDGRHTRILLVEDNPAEARLLRGTLSKDVEFAGCVEHVERLSDALGRLAAGSYDVILLDLSLPDATGLDGLRGILQVAPETPVVILTGLADEEMALRAVRLGAQDYLLKGEISASLLARALRYAIERQRMLRQLEEANQLKANFVACLSHELRTPLTAIVGYADLMSAGFFGELTPEQQEPVQSMRQNSRRLQALVDAILDLSRIEHGPQVLRVEPVCVSDLFEDMVAAPANAQHSPDVQLHWEGPPAGTIVHTDRVRLVTVVKHVIDNALKFTSRGTIRISAQCSPPGLEMSVTDTGIGIPSDRLRTIFEPFRQLESYLDRRTGGLGLGLYVVERNLELMGGHVTVESEPGRGSCFRLWIPSLDETCADGDSATPAISSIACR